MNLRVLVIGLAAVAVLVGLLELASVVTDRVTTAPAPAPTAYSDKIEPGLPSAPEIEEAPPATSPALTH